MKAFFIVSVDTSITINSKFFFKLRIPHLVLTNMFHKFKIFSTITFLIICGLYLIMVDSALEEGQSSEASSITRKTDPTDSIFCESDILHDVQMSGIYDNPEYFVNLKLKYSKDETLAKYTELKSRVDIVFEETELETFVRENFEEDKPKKCVTFQDSLAFEHISSVITNEDYKKFYKNINAIWPDCAMETEDDVVNHPEYHSLLDVPKCYIQVGDSNGMPTNWQNYLIVRGALVNEMRATAAGIMRNIAHLIETHGLAMYSNKTYYSTRSQLPLLALMVEDYLEAAETDDIFLKAILPAVEKEFLWWLNNRSFKRPMNGYDYLMFRYAQSVSRPRPEKYKHDKDLASILPSQEEAEKFYANLYSLDESGFEYTTRFQRAQPDGKRLKLDIINIVPVELMSVLHRCATLLSAWYRSLIKTTPESAKEYKKESEKYGKTAAEILKTITEVLYNHEKGAWFDFHAGDMERIEVYYATNLLPLITTSYDIERSTDIGNNVLKYLISEKIINEDLKPNYLLIPTSTKRNGGPGDFPSGSLLLNVLIIEGLADLDNYDAIVVAKELASVLVKTIHDGFLNHNSVFENYLVNHAVTDPSPLQISPAAVGGVNLLLKWFGGNLSATEYNDFKPKTDVEGEANRKRPIDEKGEFSADAEDEPNKKSRTDTDTLEKSDRGTP